MNYYDSFHKSADPNMNPHILYVILLKGSLEKASLIEGEGHIQSTKNS